MAEPLTPTFIVVGAQKCGTTALFSYLSAHPSIAPPTQKEIHFFLGSTIHAKGVDFYHAHFPERDADHPERITFEASPNYLTSAEAARRIHDYDPTMKLVALLRDPVERAFSAWQMYRRIRDKNPSWFFDWVAACDADRERDFYLPRGKSFGEDFAADIREELDATARGRVVEMPVVRHGLYHDQLSAYLEHFPRGQMFIETNERLERETAALLHDLEGFLSIPHHDWAAESLEPVFVGTYERRIPEDAAALLQETYREPNMRLFGLLGLRFDSV